MRREIWRETYGRKAPIRIKPWLFWASIGAILFCLWEFLALTRGMP